MRTLAILVVLGSWAAGLTEAMRCGQCAHTVVNITKEDAAMNGKKFQDVHQNIMPSCGAGVKNYEFLPTVECKRCGYIHTSFNFAYQQAEGKVEMFAIGCDENPDNPIVGCATGDLAIAGVSSNLEAEMDITISNMDPKTKACNCDVALCDNNPIPQEEAVMCRECGYIAIDITEEKGTSAAVFKEKYDYRAMGNCKPGTTVFSGMAEKKCRKRCGFVNANLDFEVDGAKGTMKFFGMGCDGNPLEEKKGCVENEEGRKELKKQLEFQFDFKVLDMHDHSTACSCDGENCAAKLSGEKDSAIAAAAGIVPSLMLMVTAVALKVFY